MSWTDERIEILKRMWEAGQTASQIADELRGVTRNAVIGKAHRLGLQARPSPVKPNEPEAKPVAEAEVLASPAVVPPEMEAPAEVPFSVEPAAVESAPVVAADEDDEDDENGEPAAIATAPIVPAAPPPPILRSVGPGGFVRQSPGEQQPPIAPAPPRRLVPAKPSPEFAEKTSLLELNDKICKWPLGHPGEPDFHFCGDKVNPGFPYCVAHCGHAYQAQLPRRDRRAPPPLPFGGPRVR